MVSRDPTQAGSGASLPAHTPGPWTVHYRFGRLTTVNGRQRFPICDTGTAPLGEANHSREEANARLIAAAPDLLAALQALVTEASYSPSGSNEAPKMEEGKTYVFTISSVTSLQTAIHHARAAITKALGRAAASPASAQPSAPEAI